MEDMLHSGINRFAEEVNVFSAPVNIVETDKTYELHLVAPGLKKEDIKVNLEKTLLQISYDHQEENQEGQEGKWLRNEYRHRSFKRSFALNEKIDATQITAKYNDGILQITLNKKELAEMPVKEIVIN